MARKRYKPEEIVAKLRQADVLVSQGQNIVDADGAAFRPQWTRAV
jgi:putative transposase